MPKTDTEFQDFVSWYLKNHPGAEAELANEFETAVFVVKRWADGTAYPHPQIVSRVTKYIWAKTRRICSKEHPFVPPRWEGEWWEHVDAYQIDPPDYDGSFPTFHCPNCGTTFTVDWS